MNRKLATFLLVGLNAFALLAADPSRTLNPSIGITPTTSSFDRSGGVQGIITSGSGTWYASSSVSWIKVTTVSGSAGYAVGYTVDAYNGVEKRTGVVYVSGHAHTVTQTGTAASLSSDSAEFAAVGGQGSVSVSALAGQSWRAQSNVDWITLSTTSGTGSRTITYTVNAYDEVSTRRGTLTIADNTFTVYQTGRLMKLTSNGTEVDYLGETVKIRVNALVDTTWAVSEDADWLSIADHGPGLGGGAVKITVAENPSANARSAVVTIGTESFTIKQLGLTALVFKTDHAELAVGASGASSVALAVTATPDLGWTASASEAWIVFSRNCGSGSGSVGFKVNANPTLMERRATVTVRAADNRVAVRTLEITQAAATAELTGSAYTFEAAGESVLVGVSTDAIVGWTVQNPLSWLTVTGATGTGPATLTLTAAANASVDPRSGVLTIAGLDYAVTQKGQGVSLSVQAKAFDTDGRPTDGSTENVISVTAAAGVAWTAVASDPTWIAVYVGKSGTGNGTIKYVVAPYVGGGEVREGTITVGDQIVRITQRPYRLSIEPNGEYVEPNAGAGEIQVALDIEGVWEAIATEPWIQVISGYNSGTGNGKVLYEYTDNNTGKERVGKIVISGTEYTLTQQARQRVAIDAQSNGSGGQVSGGGVYGVGDKVTLTAVAESGYVFTNWTLPSGTSAGSTISVTATASGSYKANFAALPPKILKTENALAGVRLTWTNLAWASTYNIWRGTAISRGAATKIATIAANGECCYRDTTGTIGQQYWYWVEAVGLDDDTLSDGVAAVRQRNTFAITYDNLRGTTHTNPSSYTEGDGVVFSAPSARRGFTFVGWLPSRIEAETSGDVTVRAIWKQNEYRVSYDLNGGTGEMCDQDFTYGFWQCLAKMNIVREQCVFLGWSRPPAAQVDFANSESVKNLAGTDGDVVALQAQWRAVFSPVAPVLTATQDRLNEVVLKWGELAWASEYRVYRATTDEKPLTVFKTLPAGQFSFSDATAVAGTEYRYWLDAVCDEGSTSAGPVTGLRMSEALDDDERAALGDKTRMYAQDGVSTWAAQESGSRTGGAALHTGALAEGESNVLKTVVSGPGTLSFWWKTMGKGSFVATANGLTIGRTSAVDWQQVVVELLTNTSYNLIWQYTQGAGAKAASDFGWIAEVAWTPAPATVTMSFNANGGTCATASRDYATGSAYGEFPTPTWTGRTFLGWFDAANGGNRIAESTYVPFAAKTFWAHWKVNAYAVRFNANGGSGTMADQTIAYGETKALTANVYTRQGYAFAGWKRKSAAETFVNSEFVSNLSPENGAVVELEAQWDAIDYAILYANTKGCANANPLAYTVEDEVMFAALEAPTGWRFAGWSPASIAKGSTGDKTVTAQWEQIKYAVVFVIGERGSRSGGGELSQAVAHGEAAVAPTVKAKDGYVFKCWDVKFDSVKSTLTVTAQFEPIVYSARFHANGGTGTMDDFAAVYDDDYVFSSNTFVRAGYVFVGWSTSANGSVVYEDGARFSNLSVEDGAIVDLYAIWREASEGLYFVIDLSGGATAETYPCTTLSCVPDGGWTDEHKTNKLVLRRIDPGTFIMGEDQSDESHRVTFTRGYYIGVFEVTRRQWDLVMGTSSAGESGTLPMGNISFADARGNAGTEWPECVNAQAASFVGRIQSKTGLYIDLPAAEEWEYACRAGTKTRFCSGDEENDLSEVGWWYGNSGYVAHRVGEKDANLWGLFDMHGNLGELCLNNQNTLSYGKDPKIVIEGNMIMGGSRSDAAKGCASFSFNNGYSGELNKLCGFRIVNREVPSVDRARTYGDNTETVGETTWHYYANSGGATLLRDAIVKTTTSNVVVPVSLGGNVVKRIQLDAFAHDNDENIASVTIPHSVSMIEECAFNQNRNLTAINVDPANEHYASKDGVLFNKAMTELIQYPAGRKDSSYVVPDGVVKINPYAFYGAHKLNAISIPGSVKDIDDWAFYYCGLQGVAVPEGVERVGCGAFGQCYNLYLSTVTFSSSVTNIAEGVFVNTRVSELKVSSENPRYSVIGRSLIDRENDALIFVCSTGGAYVVPQDVVRIGEGAFLMSLVSSVVVHDGVTEIGKDQVNYYCEWYFEGNPPAGLDLPIDLKIHYNATCADKWEAEIKEHGYTNAKPYVPGQRKIAYENLRGASHSNPTNYIEGEAIDFVSPIGGVTGYTFAGWSPAGITAETTGDQVVTANWTANGYSVVFHANGGSGTMDNLAMTYDVEAAVTSNAFVRSGYAFRGWATEANGEVVYADGVTVSNLTASAGGIVEFWAVWSVREYAVTFDLGAHGTRMGGGALAQSVKWGEAAVAPTVKADNGYKFVKWSAAFDEVKSALTVVAQWEVIGYAIAYADTKGCANANPAAYTVEDAVTFASLTPPAGWKFLGWSPAKIAKGSTGDRTVAAQWEQIKYVVDVDGVVDGGCVYGQEVTAKTFAEKTEGLTNVVCTGWVGTGDVPATGTGNEVAFTVTQASSLRWVYATNYWVSVGTTCGALGDRALQACDCGSVVVKDAAGVVITNELWAAAGTNLTAEATANEGWRFVGWTRGSDETPLPLCVTAPWVLRAEFAKLASTVTFELGTHFARTGGGELSQVVAYGEAAVAPTLKAEKNYVFEGWDADFSCVTSNMTVRALYGTTMPYVGAVVAAGCEAMGSVSGGKNVKTNSKASLKATAKSGYAFAGWLDADGKVVSQEPTFAPVAGTRDQTFVAKFMPVADDWVTLEVPSEVTNVTKSVAEPLTFAVAGGSLPTVKTTGTLPTGLRFTAKDILKKGSKTEVEYEANTIYGTPTKSGVYVVTVTATTASKKSVSKSVKFIVRATGETLVDADWDSDRGKVTGVGICAKGKSLTLKATANKGSVFAGWYQDAAFTVPAEGSVDYRTASFAVTGNGKDQKLYARFVPTAADQNVAAVVAESYDLNGPWTKKLDIESLSLPTVTVKGLPTGLKFDAKTLTISGTPTKPGTYAVTLSLKNVTVKAAKTQTFVLNVANIESPHLTGVSYKKGAYVYRGGVAVGWDIGSCAQDGYSVSAIAGLPAGLKFNAKTGMIEGVPTKAGTFTATITLKNGKDTSPATITMNVEAIDAWAYGTFNGGSDNGQVQLAITSAGKLTGRHLEDGVSYTLAAPSFASYEDGAYQANVTASWSYKEGNSTVKKSAVWPIVVEKGAVGGIVSSDYFDAWQNVWSQAYWKQTGTSVFGQGGTVMTLTGDGYGLQDGESVVLTIKANGSVTVKGTFDTGTLNRQGKPVYYSASGSAVVCATSDDPFAGLIFVYFAPNASKSFGGYVRVVHVDE